MPSAFVVELRGVPMAVSPWMVSDELWELAEPLLPTTQRRFRHPGRKRLPDRQALQGILFVLHTGIAWWHLPLEFGFGSGSTCYRRLVEWQLAGVWEKLPVLLLAKLRARLGRSSGRERSPTGAMCRRKGAAKRARARLIELDPGRSTISWSMRPGSRSPGRSPAATATT
jgi:transposase